MKNKIIKFVKNRWIESILVACIFSSFLTPSLNIGIISISLVALIARIVVRKLKKA